MLRGIRFKAFLRCGVVCICALIFILCGCKSPAEYKAEADEEVYNIIDGKWRDGFGQKVNYTISDVEPSPNDVQIEEVPVSGVIPLAEAVAIATANNREYQSRKEALYITALDLTLERHQYVRQWFGTIDAAYTKDGKDETISSDSELGFEQLLADGAAISAAIAIDWLRFLTGDPRTSLGSVLAATIRQPLLRGAGREVAQEELTQAERDVLYEIRSFNRFRKTFVVSIITDYYRVLQQRDAVANVQNNYETKRKTTLRLQMEAREGRTGQFRVDQAQQSELDAKDRYIRAQKSYQQLLDEFKIRLSLPTDAEIELDQDELEALHKIGAAQPDYTVDAAVETALLGRLDLATSMDRVDDAARKIMVAADDLGAELNFVGSLEVDSTEKTDFSRFRFHDGFYELGFELDLPLDRLAERNAYRRSLINLLQQQRNYDEARDNVKLDVRDAYRQLQQEAESYHAQQKRLEVTKKRVEVSPLLWETARANTRDLLEAQDDLLNAQNSLTAALVAHAIAKLNFFRDVGVLQVKPDGMWQVR